MNRFLSRTALFLIRAYQVAISPMKNAFLGVSVTCRYQPTCSQYAAEAIDRHGLVCGGGDVRAADLPLPPLGWMWGRPGAGAVLTTAESIAWTARELEFCWWRSR